MRLAFSPQNLLSSLTPGAVFRPGEVLPFSKSVHRDLKTLAAEGKITKLSGGLYYYPKHSRFGQLPPQEEDLIRTFLDDTRFLIVSPNHYNALGLGLTQLHNFVWVYNRKRFLNISLNGLEYRFKRPIDFPETLSKEYLLVDLCNHLHEIGEDPDEVKTKISTNRDHFKKDSVLENARYYGKIATRKFFEAIYS